MAELLDADAARWLAKSEWTCPDLVLLSLGLDPAAIPAGVTADVDRWYAEKKRQWEVPIDRKSGGWLCAVVSTLGADDPRRIRYLELEEAVHAAVFGHIDRYDLHHRSISLVPAASLGWALGVGWDMPRMLADVARSTKLASKMRTARVQIWPSPSGTRTKGGKSLPLATSSDLPNYEAWWRASPWAMAQGVMLIQGMNPHPDNNACAAFLERLRKDDARHFVWEQARAAIRSGLLQRTAMPDGSDALRDHRGEVTVSPSNNFVAPDVLVRWGLSCGVAVPPALCARLAPETSAVVPTRAGHRDAGLPSKAAPPNDAYMVGRTPTIGNGEASASARPVLSDEPSEVPAQVKAQAGGPAIVKREPRRSPEQTERRASIREPILKATIRLMATAPDECKTKGRWNATKISSSLGSFWLTVRPSDCDTETPPLEAKTIADLIGPFLKDRRRE